MHILATGPGQSSLSVAPSPNCTCSHTLLLKTEADADQLNQSAMHGTVLVGQEQAYIHSNRMHSTTPWHSPRMVHLTAY